MTAPKTPRQRSATPKKRSSPVKRLGEVASTVGEPFAAALVASARNRAAAEATIQALRDGGHLENVDSARIAALQALADAVDADPSNASLWREYRATEASLREGNDDTPDGLEALTAALSAPVGDKKDPVKADARPRRRRSG